MSEWKMYWLNIESESVGGSWHSKPELPDMIPVLPASCVKELVEALKVIKLSASLGDETFNEIDCYHLADEALSRIPTEVMRAMEVEK